MLYIRKLKPTLNKQLESELFTLIIRNVKLETSITRDAQKYLSKPFKQNPKHQTNISRQIAGQLQFLIIIHKYILKNFCLFMIIFFLIFRLFFLIYLERILWKFFRFLLIYFLIFRLIDILIICLSPDDDTTVSKA